MPKKKSKKRKKGGKKKRALNKSRGLFTIGRYGALTVERVWKGKKKKSKDKIDEDEPESGDYPGPRVL